MFGCRWGADGWRRAAVEGRRRRAWFFAISILATFVLSPAGATPLVQPPSAGVRAAIANHSLIVQARVVCRVYREGNQRITKYCEDGYLCSPNDKCSPGPEMRRKAEAERARRLAEIRRHNEALHQRVRDALKRMRRAEPRRAGVPIQFNCSYKPAGGGAAWDAACLNTVMSDPRRLLVLRCAPGEACPRGSGGLTVGNAPSSGYTAGTYTPGTWYTPSSDWKTIPSPQYRQGSGSVARRAGGAQPVSLRERLRLRLGHQEAEDQVRNLIAERDRNARNSAAWNAMNGVLQDLGQTLADNGLNLPEYFDDDGRVKPTAGGGAAPPTPSDNIAKAVPPPADNGPVPGPPVEQSGPNAPAPERSARDEVYCSFILYRVHSNDLAYRRMEQIPEQCRTPEMEEALAQQQKDHPTLIFDSSDREAIRQLLRGSEDVLRGQVPPES
jgi:hypothetical protein